MVNTCCLQYFFPIQHTKTSMRPHPRPTTKPPLPLPQAGASFYPGVATRWWWPQTESSRRLSSQSNAFKWIRTRLIRTIRKYDQILLRELIWMDQSKAILDSQRREVNSQLILSQFCRTYCTHLTLTAIISDKSHFVSEYQCQSCQTFKLNCNVSIFSAILRGLWDFPCATVYRLHHKPLGMQ